MSGPSYLPQITRKILQIALMSTCTCSLWASHEIEISIALLVILTEGFLMIRAAQTPPLKLGYLRSRSLSKLCFKAQLEIFSVCEGNAYLCIPPNRGCRGYIRKMIGGAPNSIIASTRVSRGLVDRNGCRAWLEALACV